MSLQEELEAMLDDMQFEVSNPEQVMTEVEWRVFTVLRFNKQRDALRWLAGEIDSLRKAHDELKGSLGQG